MRTSELLNTIKPYVIKWVSEYSIEVDTNDLLPHSISGAFHTGAIADSQAPQFVLRDGTRELTADWNVGAYKVTADQMVVDISDAGDIGLVVQGAPSQTANLQEWQDSGGTVLASICDEGRMGIGTDASDTYRLYVFEDDEDVNIALMGYTNFLNNSGNKSAVAGRMASRQTSSPFGSQVFGVSGECWITGSNDQDWDGNGESGQLGAVGVRGWVETRDDTGGTINWMQSIVTDFSLGTNSTVTNVVGFRIANGTVGSGATLTNLYGLYISDLTNGTNNYAIYTNSGDISLGDDVTFRQAAEITTSSGNLTLSAAGDIELSPTGNDVLPTTSVNTNLGSITKRYLTLHAAELWVQTLVAEDVMATIGGRIIVAPTTILTSDAESGDTTIYVEHNQIEDGDYLILESNGLYEKMVAASGPSGTGPYSYTVTRDQDGSGANNWSAGEAVVNIGQVGNNDGFLDIYSEQGVGGGGYGPTIVGNVTQAGGSWTEGWAIGNLNGLYGYSGGTKFAIGLGEYSAGDYMTIDVTNGIRFFDSGDNVVAQLSSAEWTIGNTSTEHVAVTATAINMNDGATTYISLSGGAIIVGDDSSGEYVQIDSGGIELYSNSTKVIDLDTSGNLTLGNVTENYGNAFWNISNKRLEFRGGTSGTTVEAYIDTDGSISAGSGAIKLSSDGAEITVSTDYDSVRSLKFLNETGTLGGIYGYEDTDGSIGMRCWGNTNMNIVYLDAGSATAAGYIWMQANDGSTNNTDYLFKEDSCILGAEVTYVGTMVVGPAALGFDGQIFVGDSANAEMSIGITINQDEYSDEILAFKAASSVFSHGVTTLAETDTFASFVQTVAGDGGLRIYSFNDSGGWNVGLHGVAAADITTKTTSSGGNIFMVAAKASGTGQTNMGTNANLMVIRDYDTTKFIFDKEGSAHADVEWTTYDDYDDLALLADLEDAIVSEQDPIKREFTEFLRYNKDKLEEAGVVTFGEPGHVMLNTTKLSMLLVGALRQLGGRMERLETKLLGG